MGDGSAGERDRQPVVVVAVGLTVLVLALVTADVSAGRAGTVDHPDQPMPVLGDQFAPPSPSADQPDEVGQVPAVTGAEPAWQVQLPAGVEPTSITTTPDGYLVRTQDQLVAVDADGDQVWAYDLVERLDPAKVGPDVVLVSHKHPADSRWPQPKVIVALDTATGEILWEEDEASFWAAFEGTVYMSVCYGGQNGRIGDCQFSARDLRTNTVRWRTPTYASARVLNDGGGMHLRGVPEYLVLASFPTGHASRTVTTIDPATGRQLGAGFDGHHGAATAPGTLVSIEDYDDNPADGCTAELTGYDLRSGAEVWRYTSTMSKRHDGVSCGSQPDRNASTGWLAVTNDDGRPEMLDAGTGEVWWTAPQPGRGLAATEDLLVVLEGDGADRELVLYDVSREQERWRELAPPGEVDSTVAILDEMLVTYYSSTWYSERPVGYDLATGAAWAYADWSDDPRFSFGPGWLAACDGSLCRGFDLR